MKDKRIEERPVIFSTPMVRAILAGRKTQTRRVVKPQPPATAIGATVIPHPADGRAAIVWTGRDVFDPLDEAGVTGYKERHPAGWRCPYGIPGDRLWVRETWKPTFNAGDIRHPKRQGIYFPADGTQAPVDDDAKFSQLNWRIGGALRPSIHLPRWASRITLELTDVRVQRVQEISQFDAMQEGFDGPDHKANFYGLWDTINGKRGYPWSSNVWVWALTFKVIKPATEAI